MFTTARRGGRAPRAPGWAALSWANAVKPREEARENAFSWTRRVLSAVTDLFREEASRNEAHVTPLSGAPLPAIGLLRDEHLDVVSKEGAPNLRLPEGIYADWLGGFFVSGTVPRRRYLKVQGAAIAALSDLAWRLQAGPMARFLCCGRAWHRQRPVEDQIWSMEARLGDDPSATFNVLDYDPVGVRLIDPEKRIHAGDILYFQVGDMETSFHCLEAIAEPPTARFLLNEGERAFPDPVWFR